MLAAVDLGVYAAEDIDFDGRHVKALVQQALEHLDLVQEVRGCCETSDSASADGPR